MPRLKDIKPLDKPKEEKPALVCLNCGCKNQNNFYKSHLIFNKTIPYIPYCKDCIKNVMWKYYLKKYRNNEQLALHALLRSLNLPYIHSIYLASIKNINNPDAKINNLNSQKENTEENYNKNADSNLISAYLKTYNSFYERNGYGSDYSESEGIEEINGVMLFDENIRVKRAKKALEDTEIDEEKYEIVTYDADELIFKWGDFDDEKLINLEREYLDWADKLGDYIYDKSTELIVKQVCFLTVVIQEKRALGEKVKDELASLQALLNSSGLIEKTREKSVDNVKIGMTIKEIENRRPLKPVKEELQDVDNYKELIDTFVGAMCRTLGKENYFTEQFDKIYKDYTIDLNAFKLEGDNNETNKD